MKRTLLLLAPLLVALQAADTAASPSPADSASAATAPPAATAQPAAPGSAEGASGGDARPAPWIPPEERSPRPRSEEWAKAEPLPLPRVVEGCQAARIREWVRVSCARKDADLMGARTVGGSFEDVALEDPPRDPKEPAGMGHACVVFPVRRGDRRLIELPQSVTAGFKSYSIEEQAVVMISSLWLPGDPGPTITLH